MLSRQSRLRRFGIVLLLLASAHAAGAGAEPDVELVLERLERLEQRQAELEAAVADRDERIRELEARLAQPADACRRRRRVSDSLRRHVAAAPATEPEAREQEAGLFQYEEYGVFQPGGAGFKIASTPYGDVNFSAWAYIRYLNQQEPRPDLHRFLRPDEHARPAQ